MRSMWLGRIKLFSHSGVCIELMLFLISMHEMIGFSFEHSSLYVCWVCNTVRV
uniref:Uncharacterized protein n=1 Tax=Arundo donax TaxID=35708 RepID=A0A0A9CJ50_ARUDO